MSTDTQSIRNLRRPKGNMSTLGLNVLHRRNPWVIACWSAAFPGFGHILTGSYIKGFLLFIWEITINLKAGINHAILHSFTGQFDLLKDATNKRWILLYSAVFIYSIWDSYRITVDINKYSILADREKSPVIPFKIGILAINYFDKRNPWLAAMWSLLMPGTGQLYVHRMPSGFFLLIWWIIVVYYSRFLEAIHYTFTGDFSQTINIAIPEWLLFVPSILGFAVYDAFVSCVEYNKIFDVEQAKFLKDNYQNAKFIMPL